MQIQHGGPESGRNNPLSIGEPAPWFTCRAPSNARYSFSTVAGRYVVLCFSGSSRDPENARWLATLKSSSQLFDAEHLMLFNVTNDPRDEREGLVVDQSNGFRAFWDFDNAVARQFGLIDAQNQLHKVVYVLDHRLCVMTAFDMRAGSPSTMDSLLEVLRILPRQGSGQLANSQAPVLLVPNVFSPHLCDELIKTYRQQGGESSGFMRDIGDKTVLVSDSRHKKRSDCVLQDADLLSTCVGALRARLLPQLSNAFQFQATRMERHLVACYDAEDNGHFKPHRDNTTRATAHRRFAVSLFLNSGEYDGGLLRFPEYGNALFSAPRGGAVVFSCSLQHEATPVLRGQRLMYLPFLYDEAAAQIKIQNQQFLQNTVGIPEQS